jgi:hypothetical protein
MNPKTFLSKTTSVVASIVLAIGGSLVATQPASAVATNTVAPVVSGTAAVGSTLTSNSGTWSESGFAMYGWLRCNSSVSAQQRSGGPAGNPAGCSAISNAMNSTYILTQADEGKYISSVVSWMAQSGTPEWISASTTAVAAQQQQQSVTYTNTSAASFTMSNGVATYTAGTWTASDSSTPTISFLWLFCDSSHNSDSGSSGGPAADCGPIAATDISGNSANGASWIRTSTLSIPATAFKWVSSTGGTVTVTSASLNTKHIAVYESVNGNWKVSATAAVTQTASQVTAEVTRSIPVPAFQAPILNSLAPKMTGGFSSNGGRLVLKDVKPADITSVMLNGKKVEVISSKSGAALRIPAGAGAGDLKFTMADGTVIEVANAVKITPSQVDPKLVDLNPLPTFKAGSVAVPAAIKSALTKRKAIILDSVSAKCVGYASSNTAAARATALSRASNVCGVITDINENIEPIVKVLVNKTVAKKSPVKYQTW